MNNILIISHNTLSAGTSTQTINFINYVQHHTFPKAIFHFIIPDTENFITLKNQSENVVLHYVPYRFGFFGYFLRMLVELFYIPRIVFRVKPVSVFALTNYFLIPGLRMKKVVLLRHPYIIDETLTGNLNAYHKMIEFFRRRFFEITLKLADQIVVQSKYMKERFDVKFSQFRHKVRVLPNPISKSKLPKPEKDLSFDERKNILIYPSRYYPHKNHEFIVHVASSFADVFRRNNVQFVITLRHDRDTEQLLDKINQLGLKDIIRNVGELPQEQLSVIYSEAKALFFPSKAETFGNALVEGLYFKLPIIVPDLPYAETICEEAAVYYTADNASDLVAKLDFLHVKEKWQDLSKKSEMQMSNFLDISQWCDQVYNMLIHES